MNRFYYIVMAAALLMLSCSKPDSGNGSGNGNGGDNGNGGGNTPVEDNRGPFENEVGKTLSPWAEGCLDIHAINSGRGECTFFIMPDGTSLCCDAGEIGLGDTSHPKVDQKPDAVTRPYVTYANYIKHFLPSSIKSLDYMLMTHFHNDHFGTTSENGYAMVTRGGTTWRQTGIMALYDLVPFAKMIDRAFSSSDRNYDFVTTSGQSYSSGIDQYANFIHWARSAKSLKVERAKLGSTTQIKLQNNPEAYPGFVVEVNAVNGYVKGEIQEDAKSLNENGNSISFMISYGDFDYLTSGDGGTNTGMGLPLARAINRKIEAMKAHHHFAWDTMSDAMMKIYQPKVIVSQSFYDHQPDMGHDWKCGGKDYASQTKKEFQNAWKAYGTEDEKYWYFTNIHPTTSSTYPEEVLKMKSTNGHVVIRVKEGGGEFYVYVLDDTDTEYKVIRADGPFICHK